MTKSEECQRLESQSYITTEYYHIVHVQCCNISAFLTKSEFPESPHKNVEGTFFPNAYHDTRVQSVLPLNAQFVHCQCCLHICFFDQI
jgi:hypothetical protein